jgi:hypothetical protein
LREAHLQELAQRVGFEYARLARLSSVSEAMRDPRFAQRRPVPDRSVLVAGDRALLVLVWRFFPVAERFAPKRWGQPRRDGSCLRAGF